VTSGCYFQQIQITVCHTFKTAATVISILDSSAAYMPFVVKYNLTSLSPEFDEGCGLKAE
jgi:hypothetical protein